MAQAEIIDVEDDLLSRLDDAWDFCDKDEFGVCEAIADAIGEIKRLRIVRDLAAKLLVAAGEGTAKGRAIDLIDRRYVDRLEAAISKSAEPISLPVEALKGAEKTE
jgi:RNA polymerase-binding transcription factor DksA